MRSCNSYQDIKTPEEEKDEMERYFIRQQQKQEIAEYRAEIERDRRFEDD